MLATAIANPPPLPSPADADNGESMITLDPTQRTFFLNQSRVIAACWHRQKGKDFATAAKAATSAIETRRNWYIVSLTQRQADATFAKCVKAAEAYKEVFKLQGPIAFDSRDYVEYDKWIDEKFKWKTREIIFPGGGTVVSLPGRDPDTLAGYTGNIIFTEFGLFPGGGYDHWRVVFPMTTRGFQCLAISTPRGRNTKFFELVNNPTLYSVSFCDIHKSVAEDGYVLEDNNGKPCTIDEFQRIYADDVGFQREYECQFTGDLQTLIKWAELMAAGELGRDEPFDYLRVEGDAGWVDSFFAQARSLRAPLEIGWDVARTGDLAAVWCNVATGGGGADGRGRRSLRYLVILHNTSFALQRHVIQRAMDARGWGSGVGAGDATGLGMSDNEALEAMYRGRWESVNFSPARKSELAAVGLAAYRDRNQAIPSLNGPHKFIATDLYAVQRVCDAEGNENDLEKRLKVTEGENPLAEESHCDIAYANFLSLRAGSKHAAPPLPPPMRFKPVGM